MLNCPTVDPPPKENPGAQNAKFWLPGESPGRHLSWSLVKLGSFSSNQCGGLPILARSIWAGSCGYQLQVLKLLPKLNSFTIVGLTV